VRSNPLRRVVAGGTHRDVVVRTATRKDIAVRKSTPETSAISAGFNRGRAIKMTPNSMMLAAISSGSITNRVCEVSKSVVGETSRVGSNSMCT
jgi:hypothetical protein